MKTKFLCGNNITNNNISINGISSSGFGGSSSDPAAAIKWAFVAEYKAKAAAAINTPEAKSQKEKGATTAKDSTAEKPSKGGGRA